MLLYFSFFNFFFLISSFSFWAQEAIDSSFPTPIEFKINIREKETFDYLSISLSLDETCAISWQSETNIYIQFLFPDGKKNDNEYILSTGYSNPIIDFGNHGTAVLVYDDYLKYESSLNRSNIYISLFHRVKPKKFTEIKIETPINDNESLYAKNPFVSVFNNGSFIIVWSDKSGRIFGQLCDPLGRKIGSLLNIYIPKEESNFLNPKVKTKLDGGFIVMWYEREIDQIFIKIYDKNSNQISNDIIIINKDYNQKVPSIIVGSEGDFIIVWQEENNILSQKFDKFGIKMGPSITVNSIPVFSFIGNPEISGDLNKGYVISWRNLIITAISEENWLIIQRFDSYGNFIGGEHKVNSRPSNDLEHKLAVGKNGKIITVWIDFEFNSYYNIFGKIFINNFLDEKNFYMKGGIIKNKQNNNTFNISLKESVVVQNINGFSLFLWCETNNIIYYQVYNQMFIKIKEDVISIPNTVEINGLAASSNIEGEFYFIWVNKFINKTKNDYIIYLNILDKNYSLKYKESINLIKTSRVLESPSISIGLKNIIIVHGMNIYFFDSNLILIKSDFFRYIRYKNVFSIVLGGIIIRDCLDVGSGYKSDYISHIDNTITTNFYGEYSISSTPFPLCSAINYIYIVDCENNFENNLICQMKIKQKGNFQDKNIGKTIIIGYNISNCFVFLNYDNSFIISYIEKGNNLNWKKFSFIDNTFLKSEPILGLQKIDSKLDSILNIESWILSNGNILFLENDGNNNYFLTENEVLPNKVLKRIKNTFLMKDNYCCSYKTKNYVYLADKFLNIYRYSTTKFENFYITNKYSTEFFNFKIYDRYIFFLDSNGLLYFIIFNEFENNNGLNITSLNSIEICFLKKIKDYAINKENIFLIDGTKILYKLNLNKLSEDKIYCSNQDYKSFYLTDDLITLSIDNSEEYIYIGTKNGIITYQINNTDLIMLNSLDLEQINYIYFSEDGKYLSLCSYYTHYLINIINKNMPFIIDEKNFNHLIFKSKIYPDNSLILINSAKTTSFLKTITYESSQINLHFKSIGSISFDYKNRIHFINNDNKIIYFFQEEGKYLIIKKFNISTVIDFSIRLISSNNLTISYNHLYCSNLYIYSIQNLKIEVFYLNNLTIMNSISINDEDDSIISLYDEDNEISYLYNFKLNILKKLSLKDGKVINQTNIKNENYNKLKLSKNSKLLFIISYINGDFIIINTDNLLILMDKTRFMTLRDQIVQIEFYSILKKEYIFLSSDNKLIIYSLNLNAPLLTFISEIDIPSFQYFDITKDKEYLICKQKNYVFLLSLFDLLNLIIIEEFSTVKFTNKKFQPNFIYFESKGRKYILLGSGQLIGLLEDEYSFLQYSSMENYLDKKYFYLNLIPVNTKFQGKSNFDYKINFISDSSDLLPNWIVLNSLKNIITFSPQNPQMIQSILNEKFNILFTVKILDEIFFLPNETKLFISQSYLDYKHLISNNYDPLIGIDRTLFSNVSYYNHVFQTHYIQKAFFLNLKNFNKLNTPPIFPQNNTLQIQYDNKYNNISIKILDNLDFTFDINTFIDLDNDILSYSLIVKPQNSWIFFNKEDRRIYGTPTDKINDNNDYEIEIKCTDDYSYISDYFTLVVRNYSPSVNPNNSLQNQYNLKNKDPEIETQFEISFNPNAFIDDFSNLTYNALILNNGEFQILDKSWISFDPTFLTFVIIATRFQLSKTYRIRIYATNKINETIYDDFQFTIKISYILLLTIIFSILGPLGGIFTVLSYRPLIYSIFCRKHYYYKLSKIAYVDELYEQEIYLIYEEINYAATIWTQLLTQKKNEKNFNRKIRINPSDLIELEKEFKEKAIISSKYNSHDGIIQKNESIIYDILMGFIAYQDLDDFPYLKNIFNEIKKNLEKKYKLSWIENLVLIERKINTNLSLSQQPFPTILMKKDKIIDEIKKIKNFEKKKLKKKQIRDLTEQEMNILFSILKAQALGIPKYQPKYEYLLQNSMGECIFSYHYSFQGFKSYKFKVLKKGFSKKLSKFLRLSTYPAGIGKIGIYTGLPIWLKCNMESNLVKLYGIPLKKDIGKTIIQILNLNGIILREFVIEVKKMENNNNIINNEEITIKNEEELSINNEDNNNIVISSQAFNIMRTQEKIDDLEKRISDKY